LVRRHFVGDVFLLTQSATQRNEKAGRLVLPAFCCSKINPAWTIRPWQVRQPAFLADLETLQVLDESYLEAQDFQHHVRLRQQRLSSSSVLGPKERLQQVVQGVFQAFAQDEAMVAGGICWRGCKTTGSNHTFSL
jgi:hypothetical protein